MKTHHNIVLDAEIALAIKGFNLNLSKLLNDFLRDYLLIHKDNGTDDQKKILEALERLIIQRNEEKIIKEEKEKEEKKIMIKEEELLEPIERTEEQIDAHAKRQNARREQWRKDNPIVKHET